MVVILHVIAAGRGYNIKAVARQVAETPARCGKGAVEFIAGICHAVFCKNGFQATFIKGAIVSHQGETGNAWSDLLPHIGETGLSVGIAPGKAVYCGCPVCVIIGDRLNERVEFIHNHAPAHHDYADAANARPPSVGSLKIYRYKISHMDERLPAAEYFEVK